MRCCGPHPTYVDPPVLCVLDVGHEGDHANNEARSAVTWPRAFAGFSRHLETDDDVYLPGRDQVRVAEPRVPKGWTTKPPERESRSARIMAALDALAKAQHELTMAILDVPR